MATTTCEPLLDACSPEIYSRNAFRLLALDVDQPGRQVKRREKELQAAIEVDELADEYLAGLRPRPLPTREELLQAGRDLADAQLRFIHEFFWFWPLEWGESESDEALKLLKGGRAKEAQRLWEQAVLGGGRGALAAKHNLAVLGHFLALNREKEIIATAKGKDLTLDQRKTLNTYWDFAFSHWEPLCTNEAFWSLQAERVEALRDPRLNNGFVRRFSETLPLAFDNINADLAVMYCDRDIYVRAKDHVRIMRATNSGIDDVDASLRRVTGPLQKRIDHAIATATSQLVANRTDGKRRCLELFDTVRKLVNILQSLLGRQSHEFNETCDRIAESMLQCQVAYGNETKDWKGSVPLLEVALKVARRPETRKKLEDNIRVLNENIQQGNCWFCKERHPEDRLGVSQKLHKDIYWSDVKAGKHPDLAQQIQAELRKLALNNPFANFNDLDGMFAGKVLGRQTAEISVPRCAECKGSHGGGQLIGVGVGWTLAILSAIMAANFFDGWPAGILGILGVFAGFGLGNYASSSWQAANSGSRALDYWTEFPPVKELLTEGWKLGAGSAN